MEITDRSKDVIKSGGEWISSITLENIARVPPRRGRGRGRRRAPPEMGRAAGADGRAARRAARSIRTTCWRVYAGKVPKWWLPDAVVVVDELPHTATGKLQKTALRERYRDHLQARAADAPPAGPG